MTIIKRVRTHPAIMVYGIYLYFNARSYRLVSKCLEPIVKRTYVSLWKWVQRFADCADRFIVDRHSVKQILVDETLVRIDGLEYWLWIAYEPNLHACVMMHLSRERTILVCYQFLKQLRRKYGRKTICTDGAQWYNDACRWLRLKHVVYGDELKNLVERFIQSIKDRTECFDDHFPCRKEECERGHVHNWLKMFVLYLHLGTDLRRFMMFIMMDGG